MFLLRQHINKWVTSRINPQASTKEEVKICLLIGRKYYDTQIFVIESYVKRHKMATCAGCVQKNVTISCS